MTAHGESGVKQQGPCRCPSTRLHISVDAALLVHVVQGAQHVAHDGGDGRLVQALSKSTAPARGGVGAGFGLMICLGMAPMHACMCALRVLACVQVT